MSANKDPKGGTLDASFEERARNLASETLYAWHMAKEVPMLGDLVAAALMSFARQHAQDVIEAYAADATYLGAIRAGAAAGAPPPDAGDVPATTALGAELEEARSLIRDLLMVATDATVLLQMSPDSPPLDFRRDLAWVLRAARAVLDRTPDCADGRCRSCRRCYREYVSSAASTSYLGVIRAAAAAGATAPDPSPPDAADGADDGGLLAARLGLALLDAYQRMSRELAEWRDAARRLLSSDGPLMNPARLAAHDALRALLERREPPERPDEFPPDCADGQCRSCRRCYREYVSAKMAGELDGDGGMS